MERTVLFDGICNLCNRAIRFVVRHDKKKYIRVASLQSDTGRKLLRETGQPENSLHTIIYFRGDKYYVRSSAVLYILKDIGGFWQVFYGLIIVPAFIRDFFYNTIARYRYRIFGKRNECVL